MSPVENYKNWEKNVAHQTRKGLGSAGKKLGEAWAKFWRFGRQNFTIMLIPHSERKIINFKISVFALAFLGLLTTVVFVFFVWYITSFTSVNRMLAQKSDRLDTAQANLDTMREEVGQLHRVAGQFEDTLDSTLKTVGVAPAKVQADNQMHGDLASLLNFQQVDGGAVPEVGELKNLHNFMAATTEPLRELNNALSTEKSLLVDIPSLWPLKGVRGWITNPFGPAIHPFTGQWYLHKGIDIAQRLGTPVVATANGKVAQIGYEPFDYGNYIILKHNYGFSTRYAHLSRIYVTKGQDVSRGQVIGAIGSTGLSTGPHLHYEVMIGTQVVDPTKYLTISSQSFDEKGP
ncbi:MAG: M23 family metallopeptidase [Spirochaetales bacterium]|nr:M23 family metallopeptidase [Spirochaetales bacterium]